MTTLKDDICESLCHGFDVRSVPIGYAVKSPFRWFTGDSLVFFVRVNQGHVRLEDDGTTYSELEGAGVDFSSETRMTILDELLKEHGVVFDQSEMLFHTEWAVDRQAGKLVSNFLAFMTRLQDLTFLNRERVQNTFKDDLFSALRERLAGEATIAKDEVPVPELEYYAADIVVRHKNGRVAAIFAVSNERKALEAVLFSKEIELNRVANVVPFLVYEETNMTRINKRTQSRALNSDLELAAWDGGRSGVVDKVTRHVSIKAA